MARPHHPYGARWQRVRRRYFRQHPGVLCVLGCGRAATVLDHYPLSRKQLIEAGDLDPDAHHHLRPLCKPCHDRETSIHQPGGEARRRRPKEKHPGVGEAP